MQNRPAALPAILLILAMLLLSACQTAQAMPVQSSQPETSTSAPLAASQPSPSPAASPTPLPTLTPAPSPAPSPTPTPALSPTPSPTPKPAISTTAASATTRHETASIIPTGDRLAGYIVVLDPGHQQKADYNREPIAPDSTETKIRCSSGTCGVATGRAEYIVDLEISLLLQQYLEAQGCEVYLTRTTHSVNISNIERAQFAVAHDPAAFIRVHCNGSTNAAQTGTSVYVANSGIFADQMVGWGRMLADCICAQTGGRNRGAVATDNYTGLNWATDIPSFLLELGYMTNPEEDRLLSDPDYQQKICQGIVDFVAGMPRQPAALIR